MTKCELEVMQVVWDRGQATVQEVVDALDRSLAYTTVLTTLKILHKKRGVLRRKKHGRAHVYIPAVSCETVQRSMLGELRRRLFGNSMKSLVLNLLDQQELSQTDIDEVKSAIAALEKQP
ncbi:MAG: BlaI/MecI/CopY family transcriptional regulator [Pirellulales bacterium]